MFEDPLFWVLVLPGLLLGLFAQSRIKLNVTKYSRLRPGTELPAQRWPVVFSMPRAFKTLRLNLLLAF